MFISPPQIDNDVNFISTLTKPENQNLETYSTKLLFVIKHGFVRLERIPDVNRSVATQVINEYLFTDNSSYSDFLNEDFDINSKFIYKNSYKLKVKIKSISKFSPKTILDL